MWMIFIKILSLVVTSTCFSVHNCHPKDEGWTEMIITPTMDSRAGFMQTHGFPRDIPKPPFRCRWIINNTEMHTRRLDWIENSGNLVRSGDESWRLFIYFTQLYIKAEMITVRECYDIECNNLASIVNKKIDDKKGRFNRGQTAIWSWLPFVHIELEVLDRRGAHMRVMEVNDAYGLNITWEVEKESKRKNFFSCSLIECSFNGECLAYASHNDSNGSGLGSMACRCSSPAGENNVDIINKPFYGNKCQFHNKHGHCTGPGDGYADAKQRCNGHACKYMTSRFVICECREGYSGRSCENKIVGNEVENATCYRNIAYNLSLILEHPVSNDSLGKIKKFWTVACKDVCKLHSITKMQVGFSVLVVVSGQEDAIKSTIDGIKSSRKVWTLMVKKIHINSFVRICIDSLEVNQSNSLHEKQEFSLTCVVKVNGSFSSWTGVAKSMQFSWNKDDFLVNTTVAQRFVKQVKFNLNTSIASILTVADASQWDSGLFRCNVEYQGLEVSRSLVSRLQVTEPPIVEIWPSMLILIRDGNQIVTARNESTIYCVSGKDGNIGSEYTFSWTRRKITEKPEEAKEIDFREGPEEEEDITLPIGSLLRLGKIGWMAAGDENDYIYSCVGHNTQNSDMDTELSVPVYVMTREQARSRVCERYEAMDLVWPRTLVGQDYHHECHPGDEGRQTRTCNSLGQTPMWSDTVDQDSCVRNNLANIRDKFQEFTEGYTGTDGIDQVIQVFESLEQETRKHFRPRPAEWHLILTLMTNVTAYLHTMDRKIGRIGPSDVWIRKIIPASRNISNIITFLINTDQVREKTPVIMRLIREVSLVVAREAEINTANMWTQRQTCPSMAVGVGRLDRSKSEDYLDISGLEEHHKSDEQLCDKFGVNHKALEDVSVRVGVAGNGRKNGNISIAVIYYEDLHMTIRKSSKENEGSHKTLYELNSNVVTVSMEESAVDIPQSRIEYRPINQLPPDIYLIIRLSYLNSTFNSSLVSLICASGPPNMLTDNVNPREGWQWNLDSGCDLRLENNSNQPECWCKSTGTFGLLIARKQPKEFASHLEGVSESIMFGCIVGVGLSSLTFILLVRSCFENRMNALALLKLQTTVSVSFSQLLFVLATNNVVPSYSYSFVCYCLQVFLLTALSAQVSKSAIIHCDLKPNLDPKLVKPYIFVFSLGIPVVLVSAMAICADSVGSNYWVNLPLHLIVYLVTSFFFLLVYIPLALKTLNNLYTYKSQSQADSSKFRGYEVNIRIILRSAVITAGLINLNLFSILYVNLPKATYILEWFFSLSTALIGVIIFTCYTFESESFVGIWCGFDKSNPYGVSREVRLKEERKEGTASAASAARARKRRMSVCSNCRGSGCRNGCTSPLIQSSGQKHPSPETSSETSHSLTFPKQSRMSPSDIQELARQSSLSSGENICTAIIQGHCSRCLNHIPEFKKPARAKCILRDNYEALPETPSKSPPESLSEVIERMKKPTSLPPLLESPQHLQSTAEYKGSFSSDGHSNSRRSTMTSNMTMVTSSEYESEYVQQEPFSPDKKISHYRTSQQSPGTRKPISQSPMQTLQLISPPPLQDPLSKFVSQQQNIPKPCSPSRVTILKSTTDPHPTSAQPRHQVQESQKDQNVLGPLSWLETSRSSTGSPHSSIKQPQTTKPLAHMSSSPQIIFPGNGVQPMSLCRGGTPPSTPVKTGQFSNPTTLRASHSKSLSHLKLVTPFGSSKEPIYVNNRQSIYVPQNQFKIPATAPLSRVGRASVTNPRLQAKNEELDLSDANHSAFIYGVQDSLNPKNFAPNEFKSILGCSSSGTRSIPIGSVSGMDCSSSRMIPGTSADVSCSKSSSFVSTPTSKTGPYDTLLLLHSVGERLKMDNYHIKDENKVDTAVTITNDQSDAKPGQEWIKSANRV